MEKSNSYIKHSSVGISMAVGFGAFAYGGYWLDEKYFQNYVLLYVGIFLGFVYGGYEIWKLIKDINDEETKHNNS